MELRLEEIKWNRVPHFAVCMHSIQINIRGRPERGFFLAIFVIFYANRKKYFRAACWWKMIFIPSRYVHRANMQNAFDGIVASGQEKWKRFFMALYYTSDKLQFSFFVTRSGAVSVFRCIFCNLYAGASDAVAPSFTLRSIHLFPERGAKKSSFAAVFPMFRRCVFTFSANTHSHMQRHRQYSSTHDFFRVILFCISAFLHSLQTFFLLSGEHSTRWWRDGYTVWFGRLCVILIFYVCYSLASRLNVAGWTRRVGVTKEAEHFIYFQLHRWWICVGC